MTTYAIIAVALAVFSFFSFHLVDRWTEEKRNKRVADEIEKLKYELNEAVKTGNVARMCILRKRLQDLLRS